MNCPKQYHCVDNSSGVCIGIRDMPRSVNLRYRLILINLGKRLALQSELVQSVHTHVAVVI